MTNNQKKYAAYILVVIAVIVAGFLGVQYPLPDPPPLESPLSLSPQAQTLTCTNAAGDLLTITLDYSEPPD